MASGREIRIPVIAELQANTGNVKSFIDQLRSNLSNAKLGDEISKQIKRSLDKASDAYDKMNFYTSQPLMDSGSIKAAEKEFLTAVSHIMKANQKLGDVSFGNLLLDQKDQDWIKAKKEKIEESRSEARSIKRSGASNQTEKYLSRKDATAEEQDILRRAKASGSKTFKETDSMGKNAKNLKNEVAATQKKIEELDSQIAEKQAELEQLQNEANTGERASTLKNTIEREEAQRANREKRIAAADKQIDFSQKMAKGLAEGGAFYGKRSGTLSNRLTGFFKQYEGKGEEAGKLSSDVRGGLAGFLQSLGLDKNLAQDSIPNIVAEVMKAVESEDDKKTLDESAITRLAEASQKNLESSSNAAAVRDKESAEKGLAATELYKQKLAAVESRDAKITKLSEDTSDLEEQKAGYVNLTTELNQVAAALQTFQDALTNKMVKSLEDSADQAEEELENFQKAKTEEARGNALDEDSINQLRSQGSNAYGMQNAAMDSQQKAASDADSFKKDIQNAIKQWFSVREIINTVKNGIREAYQDIQGLDKAMTNIAVVTDFSVSDLWGKINEYMSVAQQYGVTTQGVYEVSQLYYQQGLGESDVMAATTETLKMARIAGMDYASAADGMTVAIRGFKMEMADAARVTDVYSKVAAVTASDTQELVEAMSKTASSAASVGASFESTTSMIAVMIESTREAPQNIGSAMKSIISRYGELTKGVKVDQEGEEIDYNRVDTALKSVGISLKDAQGQFRDFDTVVEELLHKWDTLDSVTQRYVATVFAGNRQQSRFLALMEGAERYDEVKNAAENSEDAGLLQYSKTLDSLESKLANIKTSFQQFYMNIFNGEFVKGFLDAINAILQGFNKLGSVSGIFNLISIINGLKIGLSTIGNMFSNSFGGIISSWKMRQEELTNISLQGGMAGGRAYSQGFNSSLQINLPTGVQRGGVTGGQGVPVQPVNGTGAPVGGYMPAGSNIIMNAQVGNGSGKASWKSWNGSKLGQGIQVGGAIAGAALSGLGAAVSQKNGKAGSVLSATGSVLQGASMGAMLGPWGAVVGGLLGGITQVPALIKSWSIEGAMKEKLEKAKKAMEEADLERATKQEEARNLKQTIDNLTKLKKARFDSAEAEQEYIDAQNSAAEKFPQLVTGFDEWGNAIVDLTAAEEQLTKARMDSAKATQAAALAELATVRAQINSEAVNEMEQLFGDKAGKFKGSTWSNAGWLINKEGWNQDGIPQLMQDIYGGKFKDYEMHKIFNGGLLGEKDENGNLIKAGKLAETFEERLTGLLGLDSSTVEELQGLTSAEQIIKLRDQAYREELTSVGGHTFNGPEFDRLLSAAWGEEHYNTVLERATAAVGDFNYNQSQLPVKQRAAIRANLINQVTADEISGEYEDTLFGLKDYSDNIIDSILSQDKYQFANGELDSRYFQVTEKDGVETITFTPQGQTEFNTDYYNYRKKYEFMTSSLDRRGKLDDFNQLYTEAQQGKYTNQEIDQILREDLGLSGDDFTTAQEHFAKIRKERDDALERAFSFFGESDIFSIKRGFEGGQVKEFYQEINPLLEKLPTKYIESITAFANDLEDQVDNGKLSGEDARTLLKSYMTAFTDLKTLGLSDADLGAAQEIMANADLSSITGIFALMQDLEGLGLTEDQLIQLGITDLKPYASNLVTEYGNLQSTLAEGLKSMEETVKNAAEGLDFGGAASLINSIEGLDWSDFEFLNGEWFLSEDGYQKVLKEQFADEIELGKMLDAESDKAVDYLDNTGLNYVREMASLTEEERKGIIGSSRWNEQYFKYLDALWDEEAFKIWKDENYKDVDDKDVTNKMMGEFFRDQVEKLGKEGDEAEKMVNWLTAEYDYQQEVNRDAAEFASRKTVGERARLEAGDILTQKAGQDYTDDEFSKIKNAFDLVEDKDFTMEDDGTFKITEAGLRKIPVEYRNQVNALIENETQSTIDQISSLGESIGSGEATEFDFAEVFSYLAEEYNQTSSQIQDFIGSALQEALSGDTAKLDAAIAKTLGLDPNGDFSQVTETRKQMLASYKDSQSESILKYYELLQKNIDGTITETEFLELDRLDKDLGKLTPDLSYFTGSLYENLKAYAQSIVNNASIDFEDKEKLLADTFELAFGVREYESQFGISLDKVTPEQAKEVISYSKSLRKIANSKTTFSTADVSKMAASFYSNLGIGEEEVMSWFSYDFEEGAYRIFSDEVNEYIEEVLIANDKEYQEELEEYESLYRTGQINRQQYEGGVKKYGLAAKARAKARAKQKMSDPSQIDDPYLAMLAQTANELETNELAANMDEVNGFVDTLSSTFETLASGEKVNAEQLLEFYRSFGAELNADELQTRMDLSPVELINQIWADMNAAVDSLEGQDQAKVQEAQKKIQELQATLMDALIQSMTDNVGQLISGMSGELSFSDYQKLIDTYGIAADSAALSYSGVTLDKTSQRQLLSKMYGEAKERGIASGFGQEIWKQMSGSEGALFGGYQDVEEEMATVQKLLSSDEGINILINQWGMAEEEAKAYLEVLRQIRHESMFDENAYEFTFMDQDATDGLTKNFDNFVGQIDRVQGVFGSFSAGEAIGYQDFYNMMDFMDEMSGRALSDFDKKIDESMPGLIKLRDQLQASGHSYEDFINSVVSNTDKWGKVDIGGVAAELGISVDAAMEGMAEGMNDSLKEVARQQIKYLSSLESMLEALAILESIGDVGVKLNFEIDINGDGINDAQSWTQLLNTYMNLPEEQQKKADIELRAKMNAEQESIWNILSPGGIDFWEANVLGNILDNPDMLDSDKVQQILAKANLGQSWAEGVAEYMRESLTFTGKDGQIFDYDSMFIFDENGMATAFNSNFIDALKDAGYQGTAEEIFSNWFAQYFNELKPEEISESFTSTLNEKFANQPPIKIENGPELTFTGAKGQVASYKVDKNYIGKDGKLLEEQRQKVAKELNAQVADQNLEVDVDSEESWVVNADGNIEVKYRTLTIDYGDIPEGFFDKNDLVKQFTEEDGVKKFEVDIPGEVDGTVTLSEKGWSVKVPEGMDPDEYIDSIIQTMFGEGYGAKDVNLEDKTGEHVFQVAPVVAEESEASLTTLQSTLDGIATTLAGGLTLNINSTDATNQMNEIEQAFEDMKSTLQQPINLQVNSGTDGEGGGIGTEEGITLPDGERTIKITWDAEKIPEQDNISVGIDWVAPSLPNPGPIEVEVKWKAGNLPFPHLKAYTGTINSITGPAYADGSIGRLFSGAQLANKTLVGELGPELAVYNGQYHLLGQTGAEFVKLPKNAIVFNHLQTAGILSGQMKDARGLPLEPSSALATGNVTGPAMAGGGGGIGAALEAVRRAKSVWQGLLNSLSAAELLGGGGGGGGGGGNDLKAHIADLQEWYNLSRKIADVEQRINKLLAERELLTDGHAYLRNLRETQALLEDQVNTQEDLLKFQELQLKRQAEHINTNDLWSKFLHVDENGLLQYNEGNETNGGKGALQVLQEMNEMSGEQQTAYLASIGYTYTDNDGKVLEGSELVAKFYEELQKQIDDYDALRDTVSETETALLELEAQINEIEQEIRQNEIDLSQEIYDIIVDAWKENIENLKEQNELIKEANDAYAEGIQKAIDAERQTYEESQAIADREQLQRQLSLLRRSGGSAAEIASLEQQLDDTLKDEYFRNQEKALETIQEANERQVKLMEEQVKLQEEALEYQQENGVIWTKVYEVMQGTDAEILAFMQGHSTSFFEQSFLQQEDMLLDWAKKVGIYNEEKARQHAIEEAKQTFNQAWTTDTGKGLKSVFEGATDAEREKWKREYNEQYAAAILDGKTVEEAIKLAQDELYEHLENYKKKKESEANNNNNNNNSNNNGSNNSSNNGSNTEQREGWQSYGDVDGKRVYGVRSYNKQQTMDALKAKYPEIKNLGAYRVKFAKGGLINFTGPAWVDGSKSKPERILSAEQNRILEEGLAMNAGRGNSLKEALSSFASMLDSTIKGTITSITNKEQNSSIIVEPGAVVLNVEQLNDAYDIDELYNDITDRLQNIASRSSGRGVSRR